MRIWPHKHSLNFSFITVYTGKVGTNQPTNGQTNHLHTLCFYTQALVQKQDKCVRYSNCVTHTIRGYPGFPLPHLSPLFSMAKVSCLWVENHFLSSK